ncbi:MAG TPA: signal peptidase II [Candidatus Binataceae bacterium]|nr:signal peptidase II [Candidatus Binataceae bacterium]
MPLRGAGLTSSMGSGLAPNLAGPPAASRGHTRIWSMLALVTVPVVALDQVTKAYIAAHFHLYQTFTLVPNWLDLTYTLNPGAAFSLFATLPAAIRGTLFIVLSIAAAIVLLALLARRSTSVSSAIAFALILGGTIGNLIDRVVRGKVIDFIYFHHDRFSYPVFNAADSAITIGVAIILIFGLLTDSNTESP